MVNKNPIRTAAIALIIVAIFLVLFTTAITVGFYVTGNEPSTLVENVFKVCGVELGGLLLKRIVDVVSGRKKRKKDEDDEECEDDEELCKDWDSDDECLEQGDDEDEY